MKKKYICLALAILMLMGSVLTVHAEDYEKDGWKAVFTGKAIENNFTSAGFVEEIKELQPGDSITLTVAVKNGSDQGADWYMSNAVLQSMEDKSPAQGGAYTYVLTWTGSGDPTVLFSSEKIGATSRSAADTIAESQGLHEAVGSLEQFFYLDHMGAGEQGYITLKVALNGETHGNDYQQTLARVQLNFAVEGTGNGGNSSRTSHSSAITYSPGPVQTSDPSMLVFWSVAALASGLALLIFAIIYQKKRRGEDDYE